MTRHRNRAPGIRDSVRIYTTERSYDIAVGHRVRFNRSLRRLCVTSGMCGTVVGWCIATLYIRLDDAEEIVAVDSHFHDAVDYEMSEPVEALQYQRARRRLRRY